MTTAAVLAILLAGTAWAQERADDPARGGAPIPSVAPTPPGTPFEVPEGFEASLEAIGTDRVETLRRDAARRIAPFDLTFGLGSLDLDEAER